MSLLKKFLIIPIIMFCIIFASCSSNDLFGQGSSELINESDISETGGPPTFERVEILISAVGDCTLGNDPNYEFDNSFNSETKRQSDDYFFSGVKPEFEKSDYVIANFEGTLTNSSKKRQKRYNFRGPPEYVNILTSGGIGGVNLANNHCYDYNETGFLDTQKVLTEAGIDYWAEDVYLIKEIKGVRFGFAGFNAFDNGEKTYKVLDKVLEEFNEKNVQVKVISFHWGIEYQYSHNGKQTKLAHYAIDKGADLIIGHHPHVIQGIEKYKEKYIVYSLGNFCFGGNYNPNDKDSLIFQQKFIFEGGKPAGEEVALIPVSISSVRERNDYQPTILSGKERERVLKKINKDSVNFDCLSE